MALIIRNRTIRPSVRKGGLKPYRIYTKAVSVKDTLEVNIYYKSKSFRKIFCFEGKDVAHIKALSKGGSNKNGTKLQTPSTNRSFKRGSNHKVVSEVSTKERKKK